MDGKSTCSREHGLRLSIVFWSKWALETSSVVVRLYSFNVIVVVFKSEVCFIYIRQMRLDLLDTELFRDTEKSCDNFMTILRSIYKSSHTIIILGIFSF